MKTRVFFILTCFILFGALSTAVAQDEASAASLYNQGLEKAKAKQYVEALALLEQSIKAADPEADAKTIELAKKNGTRAAYGAGGVHRKAGDLEKAMEAYEKGIEYNPSYYANYRGRALVHEAEGKTPEAVSAYIEAGEKAEKSGATDKAKPMYDKAENLIAVTWGQKDWDKVASCSEAYLESRSSANVEYYMAHACHKKGDSEKSLDHIDKALEEGSDDDASKYYFLKAEVHETMGQKEAAISAYRKVTDAKYKDRAAYKVTELGG